MVFQRHAHALFKRIPFGCAMSTKRTSPLTSAVVTGDDRRGGRVRNDDAGALGLALAGSMTADEDVLMAFGERPRVRVVGSVDLQAIDVRFASAPLVLLFDLDVVGSGWESGRESSCSRVAFSSCSPAVRCSRDSPKRGASSSVVIGKVLISCHRATA